MSCLYRPCLHEVASSTTLDPIWFLVLCSTAPEVAAAPNGETLCMPGEFPLGNTGRCVYISRPDDKLSYLDAKRMYVFKVWSVLPDLGIRF